MTPSRRPPADPLPTLARGALAGALSAVPQAAVGKAEELLFLPPHEDADIAPRFMERLGEAIGREPEEGAKWALGTLFHFGYGAGWGALYALASERTRLPPLVGGTLLASLIYGITFPRWGGAVRTRTERPPGERTSRMTAVALSVTLAFGLSTALLYERLRAAR